MQRCSECAKHVAAMLGSIEERFLGGDELGEICRADFAAELSAVPDKNADLAETFPSGVAFHHAGATFNCNLTLLYIDASH